MSNNGCREWPTAKPQSRELSKSHGSLNPLSTNGNSKSYRGLRIFSPETLDESNIIYKPGAPHYREDFEHIRNRGGFKGWVKNLVDKFSKCFLKSLFKCVMYVNNLVTSLHYCCGNKANCVIFLYLNCICKH